MSLRFVHYIAVVAILFDFIQEKLDEPIGEPPGRRVNHSTGTIS